MLTRAPRTLVAALVGSPSSHGVGAGVRRAPGTRNFPRLIIAGLLAVVTLGTAAPVTFAGKADEELAPPTQLRAIHRSGQTFLTWREVDTVTGEQYLVYRFRSPIGPKSAGATNLIATLGEGSSRMWSDRIPRGGWHARYLERAVIERLGPQLDPDQGLFVWTPGRAGLGGEDEGDAYYAVVTAKGDRRSVAAPTDAVRERIAEPRAVLATRLSSGKIRVMVQYMDMRTWNPTFEAPRHGNQWLGYDPDAPGVSSAMAVAFTYAIAMPVALACPGGRVPATLPVVVMLHGSGHGLHDPDLTPPDWCAIEVRPYDRDDSRWFGFAMANDYRSGAAPGPNDVVANYTESRLLRMVHELLTDPDIGTRVDPHRIYVTGRSMGGAGTLGLAIRYPQVFAAGLARAAISDYLDAPDALRAKVAQRWGAPEFDLPIRLFGPATWIDPLRWAEGTGVWTWQDHSRQVARRPAAEMAPVGLLHGTDDRVAIPDHQLVPVALSLEQAGRTFAVRLRVGSHGIDGWDGMPGSIGMVNGVPFAGLRARNGETIPALGRDSVTLPLWPPSDPVGVNTGVEWSASWHAWDRLPLDRVRWWAMSLRSTDKLIHVVDVTPRRTQRFRAVPGKRYAYTIRSIATGKVVEQGRVRANAHGLVSVRCAIGSGGVRLIIRPV